MLKKKKHLWTNRGNMEWMVKAQEKRIQIDKPQVPH